MALEEEKIVEFEVSVCNGVRVEVSQGRSSIDEEAPGCFKLRMLRLEIVKHRSPVCVLDHKHRLCIS